MINYNELLRIMINYDIFLWILWWIMIDYDDLWIKNYMMNNYYDELYDASLKRC